jgi:signal peptidase
MPKKISAKTRKIIFGICSSLVLIFSLFILFSVIVSRMTDNSPTLFGYSFNIVLTDSMEDEINIGDLVIAKKVQKSEIKAGDDIVFISDNPDYFGVRVVHRVKEVKGSGFKTYGIKYGADDPMLATKIIGKVVHVSTGWGKMFSTFGSIQNIIFFVAMIFMLGVIGSLIRNIVVIARGKKSGTTNAITQAEKDEIRKQLIMQMNINSTAPEPIGQKEEQKKENAKNEELPKNEEYSKKREE